MEKETTNENFLKVKNIKLHKYLYMTQWTIIIFKHKNCKTTKKNIKLYGRHNPVYMKLAYRDKYFHGYWDKTSTYSTK